MLLTLEGRWRVRLDRPIDISIPVRFDGVGPRAFGLPRPQAVQISGLTTCRCETVTLTPHGNGTHTECVSHVDGKSEISVLDAVPRGLVYALLKTIDPKSSLAEDFGYIGVVDFNPFDEAAPLPDAVVLRTLPNEPEKMQRDWSGTQPPFVSATLAGRLRMAGVDHLIVDLPSVDPEQDGGRLEAHRAFFGTPGTGRTITEMAYIPDDVPDGRYLLDLQVAPLRLDAAPSRPLLYPLEAL